MSSESLVDALAPGPVRLTLPDGSTREFPGSLTGEAFAAAIGPRLAKAALAIRIDGEVKDLATRIDELAGLEEAADAVAATALDRGLGDDEAATIERVLGRLEAALRARTAAGIA